MRKIINMSSWLHTEYTLILFFITISIVFPVIQVPEKQVIIATSIYLGLSLLTIITGLPDYGHLVLAAYFLIPVLILLVLIAKRGF